MRETYRTMDNRLRKAVIATDYEAVQALGGSGANIDMYVQRITFDEEDDQDPPDIYKERIHLLAHAIWSYSDLVRYEPDLAPTGFLIFEWLVEEGADINVPVDQDAQVPYGFSILGYALEKRCLDVFEFLIRRPDFDPEKIADLSRMDFDRVDDTNEMGKTALMLAVEFNRVQVVEALLAQAIIGLNVRDRNGKTALGIAEDLGHEEIAELLRTAYAER